MKGVEVGYSVYKHTTPSSKVYIGITKNEPKKRWKSGSGYYYNHHFRNAIKKYGWNNILHEILFTDLSKEEAELKEIELISFYDSTNKEKGYNNSPGGNARSEESILKAKETAIKNGTFVKNGIRTKLLFENDEFKTKHSEGVKKSFTDERKKEYSQRMQGNKVWESLSDDKKEKIKEATRKSATGRKSVHSKVVYQLDRNTLDIINEYESSMEASRIVGVTKNCIASVCRNKTHGCKGYVWCYKEDYTEDFKRKQKELLVNENSINRRMSIETRNKLKSTEYMKAHRHKVLCVEKNKIYDSIAEASFDCTGKYSNSISSALRKGTTAHGYHWLSV